MFTAEIREKECIGCNRCVQACPVDAIVGANKFTHTVLLDECIGCKLCLNPCPVDCIDILPLANKLPTDVDINKPARAEKAKLRSKNRNLRLQKEAELMLPNYVDDVERKEKIKENIAAALSRVQSKNKGKN